MKKIKFGIQLFVLMLAFPVFFITEMKKADKDRERIHPQQKELMETETTKSTEMPQNQWHLKVYILPGLKLM